MAKKSSQRYLSGRVKITKNVSLSTDRHLYVEPGEVEPNLGYPGEKDVPVSDTYYRLVTIPNGTVYDRYWQPDSPAELVEGISVFDESILVGTANSISKIDFIGAAVSASANVGGSIATVTVYSPGSTGQVIFNQNNDFSAATDLFYDSSNKRVGIGTSAPTQQLHLQGSLRITGNIHDENNVVGVANSILIATGTGISWTSSVSSRVEVGPTPPGNAQQGDLWWDNEEGDLNVFYEDVDSSAWVSTNANSQEDDSLWELDPIGIHTTKNVGIGTTIASAALAVGGNAIFKGTGIVTATEFHGTFFGLSGGEISVGAGGTWGVSSTGIHTSKNVGIGSTLPGVKLDVDGTSRFKGDVRFVGSAGVTSAFWDKSDSRLKFKDESKTVFGDGADLQIYHTNELKNQNDSNGDSIVDGRTSVIKDKGSGGIVFKTDGADGPGAYQFFDQSWQPILKLHSGADSRAVLFHNGTEKLITSEDGINITGHTETDTLRVSGLSTFQQSIELDSTLVDIHDNVGLARSVLTSTGAGVSWGNAGANVFIGDNPPPSPVVGDLWWDSDSGEMGILYDDTNSEQWVTVSQGPAGPQGASGAGGAQGAPGNPGAQGAAGPQGAQGAPGAQGAVGAQGASGNPGAQGAQGAPGAQGAVGAQGAQGSVGAQGSAGNPGAQGAAGNPGAQGAVGSQGAPGAQGSAGNPGAQGATGNPGAQGAGGSNGDAGAQGAAGNPGAQGSAGNPGNAGAQGSGGNPGAQGATGNPGAQGAPGTGNPGAQGAQGTAGAAGGGAVAYFYESRSSGTAGGSFTSGAWRHRSLNAGAPWPTSGSGITLTSNSVQLGVGVWLVEWSAPAHGVDMHQTRLFNVTDSTSYMGSSELATDGMLEGASPYDRGQQTRSMGTVRIWISSGTKTFRVEHRCSDSRNNTGFGYPGSFATEVYTWVKVLKIE